MASVHSVDLARVAGLIGQPVRATMLGALMSGRWLTATELARLSRVAPSTASQHLTAMVEARLIRRRKSGRHHYFALVGADVAEALEGLMRLSAHRSASDRPLSASERALRFARTCYDHLAGELGVLLADTLVERGMVSPPGLDTTPAGESFLGDLGIEAAGLKKTRRKYVRFCLDWSERRDHLAGAVGAAITLALLERDWIVPMKESRAVRLTLRGKVGLHRLLGIPMERIDIDS